MRTGISLNTLVQLKPETPTETLESSACPRQPPDSFIACHTIP